MAMSFYGVLSGIATGLTIIICYFGWAIAVVGLADVTLLPDSVAKMDIMYGGYKALQAFMHHHQVGAYTLRGRRGHITACVMPVAPV